ncbi:MAG TPA: PAS domain S-box protein [Bryobacteraceae bacterium]|nr:PAS domain S-box protein [Bryobacteraceae bacterium]
MVKRRILIAEEKSVYAEQLRQSLISEGYEVAGIVSSGEDVIAHSQQSRPDLIVMSMALSGSTDGIEALERIQPLGIPVVYLAALSDRDSLDRAQHTNPLAYVIKPTTRGQLVDLIERAFLKEEQGRSGEHSATSDGSPHLTSDEQFRLMVADVNDVAIFTLDVHGNVSSWNRGAAKMNGYNGRQIIGRPHSVLYTAEDQQGGVAQMELELAKRNGSVDDTRWLVRQNGEHYWAEGVLTAIRDREGNLVGFTKVVKDGTPHKRDRDNLHKTQEKLRIALRAARMGTWDWDIKSNRDTLDENLRELFGLSADHQVNTIEDFYALIHEEDRPHVIASFDRTRLEGVHLDTVFRVSRPDGTQRWLIDQGEVLFDADGQPERMTGACVDVTERKNAEVALRESEERFRLFVNGVQDYALFQMSLDGSITSWNPGAERVLGYTEEEIIGKPSAVLFVPEDVASGRPQREMVEALSSGRAIDERWHLKKGGARFWCSGVLTRITDEQGTVRGFAKVMRDETQQRLASEELTTSLAEKEALLQEIHHRVKNNLQVITSLLSLQSDTVEDDAARTMFEEAVNRVRTIGDIHELLYRSPDLARVDFDIYLNRLAQNLQSFYGVDSDRIRVRVHAKNSNLEIVQAIPCGLIVNELLTNCFKHGFPDGRAGEIRVSLQLEGGKYLLEVSDTGVGLPGDWTPEGSTSLGLRLVSVLAGQLQGDVEVVPRAGASFVISFPSVTSDEGAQLQ